MTAPVSSSTAQKTRINFTFLMSALAAFVVVFSTPREKTLAWLSARLPDVAEGVLGLACLVAPPLLVAGLAWAGRALSRGHSFFAQMAGGFVPGVAFGMSIGVLTEPFGRAVPMITALTGPLTKPDWSELLGVLIAVELLMFAALFAGMLAMQRRQPAAMIADDDLEAFGPRDRGLMRLAIASFFGEGFALVMVLLLRLGEGGPALAESVLAAAAVLGVAGSFVAQAQVWRRSDEFERALSLQAGARGLGLGFYTFFALVLIGEVAPSVQITGFSAFIVVYGVYVTVAFGSMIVIGAKGDAMRRQAQA
ncbi:MAG: hypothetical protein ACFB2Z_12720 [Maricaulaceae bacterium]